MSSKDPMDRTSKQPTPGGATGGGVGSRGVSPDSPGNDQGGIVGSGAVWHSGAKPAGSASGGASGSASPPGMMGDGTEEQDLGQRGNPDARITEEEVDEAFAGEKPKED